MKKENIDYPEYFNKKSICQSCNTRTKKENQIVCTNCHKTKLKKEKL